MGFNPYAATFSSSTQAVSAMNAIGAGPPPPPGAASSSAAPPPAPFPAIPQVAAPSGGVSISDAEENGAVYVLLRQDPARAITAAETIIKMLTNVVNNPQVAATCKATKAVHDVSFVLWSCALQEEKFRKIRLSNAAIQSKLVAVPGAVDILAEAGFSRMELDGEVYLMLTADAFQVERVQSAIDRTEVALIQLQHDSASAAIKAVSAATAAQVERLGASAPSFPGTVDCEPGRELVGLLVRGLLVIGSFTADPDEVDPPTSPAEGPEPDPDALTDPATPADPDLPQRCRIGLMMFACKQIGPILHSSGAIRFVASIAFMQSLLLQTAVICASLGVAIETGLYPELALHIITFLPARSFDSAVVLQGAWASAPKTAIIDKSITVIFIGVGSTLAGRGLGWRNAK
ncbi:unnamed protein product [Phytophthora fragariaefolia]|uniref:Unnamed protein product n=1 Tax=Phytophthora fragariaefolia TaxID=1490495 RepID=A0A9W6X2K3_9STRA|nr:unnamed protein product [Phytophthora fragariaefolia]